MLCIFLIVLAAVWLTASLFAVYLLLITFHKYRNVPRVNLPPKYQAAIRQDFHQWDKAALIKGAFLRFPGHIATESAFLLVLGLLLAIKHYIGMPESIIEAYRVKVGRLVWQISFNLVEELEGPNHIRTPLIIGNHVSELDALYKVSCLPSKASFVSKKQNGEWKVFKTVGKYLQCLYFERSSVNERKVVAKQLHSRIRAYELDSVRNLPVVVYPEGTVSNGRGVLRFKRGAFQPMVPMTLVALRYQCDGFHPATDQIEGWENILMTYCMRPTLRVRREWTAAKQGESVDEYKQRCRVRLAEMSEMQLSACTAADAMLYWKNISRRLQERLNKT